MFAGLAGILIGLAARMLARHRDRYGVLVVPAWSGIVALVLWEALTWLGKAPGLAWLAYDNVWIWVITLGATAVFALLLATSLGTNRRRDDDELLDRLSHLGRASV